MDLAKTLQQAASDLAAKAADMVDDVLPDNEPVGKVPTPVTKKVSVIIYNPQIKEGGQVTKLSDLMKWNHPDTLIPKYIADLKTCSHGYANYEVVERLEVDKVPAKLDGFVYKPEELVQCLRTNTGFHNPDGADYHAILKDFDIINKINSGKIDEVWLFAFPYGGFYESIMAGPGAFWCNAPALEKTETAKRRFVIMGYNYQRGVGEMIENLGHRAESILEYVYRQQQGDDNIWKRFSRYDKTHPGQAEVGIVHYAPNSDKDYDWGNKKKVKSRYHLWRNFPNLTGDALEVDDSHWGKGDTRAHHMWWFDLFPHITGGKNGIAYNWWRYVIDPNTVR